MLTLASDELQEGLARLNQDFWRHSSLQDCPNSSVKNDVPRTHDGLAGLQSFKHPAMLARTALKFQAVPLRTFQRDSAHLYNISSQLTPLYKNLQSGDDNLLRTSGKLIHFV